MGKLTEFFKQCLRINVPALHGLPVVIAIISVMAAVLLPALNVAGDESKPAPSQVSAAAEMKPIDVGDRKQIFFDDKFIADSHNIEIVMNPPKKLGPVLKPDNRWEDFRFTTYFSVVQDGALCRMYYSAFDEDQWNFGGNTWRDHAFLCMAESEDGINWRKPNLGIVEYKGSKENNIIARSIVDGTVFIDPVAPLEKRYKMLHTVGLHEGGLRVSYSADGSHFNLSEQAVMDWDPDSQQNAFYDSRIKKYVAYLRARSDMGISPNGRSVIRVEIDNIENSWKGKIKPHIVFQRDVKDTVEVDFYTNAAVKYPWADDVYFMFPALYHHFPPQYGNDGLLDSSAAASRDGIHWLRIDRRPYISLGQLGEFDSMMLMVGVGMVRYGDKIYQYYNGVNFGHGATREESKIKVANPRRWGWMGAAEQRLDGFYSADADYTGGTLTTPPVIFNGSRLEININTSAAGIARVELQNTSGQPIPGYRLGECDLIMTNNVRHVVRWSNNPDVSKLDGKPVILHFQMQSAKLYAFQFTNGNQE